VVGHVGGAADHERPTGAEADQAIGSTAPFEAAVESYLTELLGTDRAGPRVANALAELSALANERGSPIPDRADVRTAAQRAGLEGLADEARSLRRRIVRTATGRRQCLAVARRLRDRARGEISARELAAFYRHLERCASCAGFAGRFEACEWRLQVELAALRPKSTVDPPVDAPGPAPTKPRSRRKTAAAAGTDADSAAGAGVAADSVASTDPEVAAGSRPQAVPAPPAQPDADAALAEPPGFADPDAGPFADAIAPVTDPAPAPAVDREDSDELDRPADNGWPNRVSAPPDWSESPPAATRPAATRPAASARPPAAQPAGSRPLHGLVVAEPESPPASPDRRSASASPGREATPSPTESPAPAPATPLRARAPATATQPARKPAARAAGAIRPSADQTQAPPAPEVAATPATSRAAQATPPAPEVAATPATPRRATESPTHPEAGEPEPASEPRAPQAPPEPPAQEGSRRIEAAPGLRAHRPGRSTEPVRAPAPSPLSGRSRRSRAPAADAASTPAAALDAPGRVAARGSALDRTRRRFPLVPAIAVIALLAAAGAAVVLSGVAKPGSATRGPILPLERTTTSGPSTTTSGPNATTAGANATTGDNRNTTTTTLAPPAAPKLVVRGAGTPVVVDRARFTVLVNAQPAWASFAKTVSPGPGNRWVAVTMSVRNIARVRFDPRVLHYRLISAGGVDFFPDLRYGTGPAARLTPNGLADGEVVQVELAFRVPTSAAGLRLAFDPTGGLERVEIRLGR
jgi:hypothetical protein